MVGQVGQDVSHGGLLATSVGGSGDEERGDLAIEGALGPQAASLVPEGGPLSWQGTETGGKTENKGVVLGENLLVGHWNVVGLGWRVHLGEHLVGERLLDAVQVSLRAGVSLDTLLDRAGKVVDVAVGGVGDDSDLHCCCLCVDCFAL